MEIGAKTQKTITIVLTEEEAFRLKTALHRNRTVVPLIAALVADGTKDTLLKLENGLKSVLYT
jgi:hypothetical protein